MEYYRWSTMSGSYFRKQSWPAFVYQGQTYEFTHLDDYDVEVIDSEKKTRRIAVSFSDHCFTREADGKDDPALLYPQSTRAAGYFCIERYHLSLNLRQHIAQAMQGKVWNIAGENFATIPTVDRQGILVLYGIVFSLDRVKKRPVDLDMRVRTAYPCDEKNLVTFGTVRFVHLVTLRMQGKRPNRNLDRRRPKPTLRRGQK
jgi:hypothetical protein